MSSLDLLVGLKDGWDGPESVAISPFAISCYVQVVQAFDAPRPELEPMGLPSGGIRMEWEDVNKSLIVEIDFDGYTWVYCEDNAITKVDRHFSFDVNKVKYFIEHGEYYCGQNISQVVLDTPLFPNVVDSPNIGNYLVGLLAKLWVDKDGFSSKRPFGDSDWEHELYKSLALAGLIQATIDEDGYLEDFDQVEANNLIYQAIHHLYRKDSDA